MCSIVVEIALKKTQLGQKLFQIMVISRYIFNIISTNAIT